MLAAFFLTRARARDRVIVMKISKQNFKAAILSAAFDSASS
jgi:hypothetical protein